MASLPREYFSNGKSILLSKYQDVEDAKNDQEIEALNSMESGMYQSSIAKSLNQTGNQFQGSTRFNNQTNQAQGPINNNYVNENNELNSLYSPHSNNDFPIQNFDINNNLNHSNGNGFQTQKNFYRTDNQNYASPNQYGNTVGMRTDYKAYYPNNQNVMSQTQMSKEMKENLERLVENLYDYYYTTKGYFQNDPKELYNFYYEYKKRHNKGMRVTERIKELMYYREEDVEKCIYDHLNVMRSRIRNGSTNFGSTTFGNTKIKKSVSYSKTGGNNINNTYSNKFTKDTLRRLYPKQEEMEQREKQKLNCDNFNLFFNKLLNYYYKVNGKKKLTNNKDEIIDFWQKIPDKRKKGLEWENGEKDLIEEIELFFNDEEIVQRLSDNFFKHTKLRTYHPRPLHDFWQFDLTEFDKYFNGLYKYNKDDTYLLLNKYYEQYQDEQKEKIENSEKEKKENEQKEIIERKRKILETKDEREKRINKLAEPKDKYKTGRKMYEIYDKFKYDNIIKKMIKNEFKDNKIFKFPEEYAVRDEDEQKDILFKHDLEKGIKPENIEEQKKHEEKIKQQIEEAYDNYEYVKDKYKPQREQKMEEKNKLFDFIKNKVKEYYKKMSKRLENGKDGIESINIFLNNMYKEMSRKHRNATRRYFKRPRCEVLKKAYRYKKTIHFIQEN